MYGRVVGGSALVLVALGALLALSMTAAVVERALGADSGARWPVSAVLGLGGLTILAWFAWRRDLRVSADATCHDALTGLGSRHRLLVDLERATQRPPGEQGACLLLLNLDDFRAYNATFGQQAGDDLLRLLGPRLASALPAGAAAYRTGGGEFAVVAEGIAAGDIAALASRSSDALREWSGGFTISAAHGSVTIPDEADSPSEALAIADRRLASHSRFAPETGAQCAAVLMQAISERDATLGLHLAGIAELSAAVARRLEVPTDEIKEIEWAARLLDIGTLAVPAEIMSKPGPLDDRELAFIRQHTVVGERIVAATPALAHVGRLIRSSHERYDGGGYPDGLSGRTIPLGSRIIAVCCAFAAMVTDRPYRRSLSYPAAIAELACCAGTQFDPVAVGALLAELEDESSALADAV